MKKILAISALSLLLVALLVGAYTVYHRLTAEYQLIDGPYKTLADGTVIKPLVYGFGDYLLPKGYDPLDKNTQFKIVFNTAYHARKNQRNIIIDRLARFLNLHHAIGIKTENMQLALIVRGKGVFDLFEHKHYKELYGVENKNQSLIEQLLANGVKIYACGQTPGYTQEQLIPGVQMSLSAMTMNAQLQQQGYTVNPFNNG